MRVIGFLAWQAVAKGELALALSTARVDCWAVHQTAAHGRAEEFLRRLLSPDEVAKADRFRIQNLRERYIARHAALRIVVARYLEARPASLRFVEKLNGRPSLVAPAGGIHFNLSHAGDLALIAVSRLAPVGVDVEQVRDLPNLHAVARDHFAPTEIADLDRQSAAEKLRSFFVTWTRKEAFVKAIGAGLSFPLDAFSTGSQDGAPVLRAPGSTPDEWTMADLVPGPGFLGALAIRRPGVAICCRRAEWPWLLDGA